MATANYLTLLGDRLRQDIYLYEVTLKQRSDLAAVTLYFATHEYALLPTDAGAPKQYRTVAVGLFDFNVPVANIEAAGLAGAVEGGLFTLGNKMGELDSLRDTYHWSGGTVVIKHGGITSWNVQLAYADFEQIRKVEIDQALFGLDTVTIKLRELSGRFDDPFERRVLRGGSATCEGDGAGGSYISYASATKMDIRGSFSGDFWIYPETVASVQHITGWAAADPWRLVLTAAAKFEIRRNTDAVLYTSTTVLTAKQFYHIAFAYDVDLGVGWVAVYDYVADLETYETWTDAGVTGAAPTGVFTGHGLAASESFDGQLDELRIWHTTKTILEMRDLRWRQLTDDEAADLLISLYHTFDNDISSVDNAASPIRFLGYTSGGASATDSLTMVVTCPVDAIAPAGSELVVSISVRKHNVTAGTHTMALPAGWTLIPNGHDPARTQVDEKQLLVFKRTKVAGDTTWNFVSAGTGGVPTRAWICTAVDGFDAGGAIIESATTGQTGNITEHDVPELTIGATKNVRMLISTDNFSAGAQNEILGALPEGFFVQATNQKTGSGATGAYEADISVAMKVEVATGLTETIQYDVKQGFGDVWAGDDYWNVSLEFNAGTGIQGGVNGGLVFQRSLTGGLSDSSGVEIPNHYGQVENAALILVDPLTNTYIAHGAKIKSFTTPREGGAARTIGTAYTDLKTFLDGTQVEGTVDTLNCAVGAYVRYPTMPELPPTVDLIGDNGVAGSGYYQSTASDIARRILTSRGAVPLIDPTDLDVASFLRLKNADKGARHRLSVKPGESIKTALDRLLKTCGAVMFDRADTGLWAVYQYNGVDNLEAALTVSEKNVVSLEPAETVGPFQRVVIPFRHNPAPFASDQISLLVTLGPEGGAPDVDRWQFLRRKYFYATAYNDDLREAEPRAGEIALSDGTYVYRAAAQREANRRLTLHSGEPQVFNVVFDSTAIRLDRFHGVILSYVDEDETSTDQNRLGMTATAKFVVLGVKKVPSRGELHATLFRESSI